MCVKLHKGKSTKHELFTRSILRKILFFKNLEYNYLQKLQSIIFLIYIKLIVNWSQAIPKRKGKILVS